MRRSKVTPQGEQSQVMKVLCDASVIRPPLSGVQLAVRHEILSLLQLPAVPDMVVCTHDEMVHDTCLKGAAAAVRLAGFTRRTSGRILWQQLVLPRLLRRWSVDVLHAFAYTAPLRCPIPYVLNVHDTIALDHPELCSWPNARHMRCLMPGSIRRASAIVVSSTYVRDRVRHLFGLASERIHVVPLGVDLPRFSSPPSTLSPGVTLPSRPYLLYVGNLEPKKGLPSLLEAYSTSAEAIGWDLVLAGRPAWRSSPIMGGIHAYSGPGKVIALGPVADADLPGLYQQAQAFVFPSITEGFGLPVLEAMAAGTPVVHSDCPAVTETAGGAGLSFARGDASELGRALKQLAGSVELQDELRTRGKLRAAEMTWQRWAEHVCRIYPYVLTQSSLRPQPNSEGLPSIRIRESELLRRCFP